MKYGNLTLGQIEAGINKIGGEEAFMRLLRDELVITEAITKKLLDMVTTTDVVGINSFVAAEKFREGKTVDGVKIAWIGSNFENNFLGKTETDVASATLRISRLNQDSLDAPIIAELGDACETTLAHFWDLLKMQGSGRKGKLLVNGYANIAYIRDKNDVLWAVYADWYSVSDGWCVEAYSVTSPNGWYAGSQVVSR